MTYSDNQLYSHNFGETVQEHRKRSFKIQYLFDEYFIGLDPSVNPHENERFIPEREPNGDIHLRKITQ